MYENLCNLYTCDGLINSRQLDKTMCELSMGCGFKDANLAGIHKTQSVSGSHATTNDVVYICFFDGLTDGNITYNLLHIDRCI